MVILYNTWEESASNTDNFRREDTKWQGIFSPLFLLHILLYKGKLSLEATKIILKGIHITKMELQKTRMTKNVSNSHLSQTEHEH